MIKIQKFMNNYVVSGLNSRVDAEEFKADMLTLLHEYGKVSLADMYDLAGLNAPDCSYNRRGWNIKETLERETTINFNFGDDDCGWYIILPPINCTNVSHTIPSYRYSRNHNYYVDPNKPGWTTDPNHHKKYLDNLQRSFSEPEPHSTHITIDTDAFDNGNISLGEIFDFVYAIKDRDVFVSII